MHHMKNQILDDKEEAASKQKTRHIVTWTKQEDDILREQINIHGTENWAIVASKFKDKTTRQCRRRWYTYLNSDFKKGGWSPEEDMILCEAQKLYGNRWTEIAKVVSGRTDNAVKNRFTTLCKKKAKREALAKENNAPYINTNNKRVSPNTDGTSETEASVKKMSRYHIPHLIENSNPGEQRPPFAVLVQNIQNAINLQARQHIPTTMESANGYIGNNKIQGTFLRKDDPKMTVLMQQAELLSSLAQKVNTENTDQSLENAWKILQDFLRTTRGSDLPKYNISDMDIPLEDLKDLVEDVNSSNKENHSPWRQPDHYESPSSSEYSTGSTLVTQSVGDKTEQAQAEMCELHQGGGPGLQTIQVEEEIDNGECEKLVFVGAARDQEEVFPTRNEQNNTDGVVSALSNTDFSSPLQVIPFFRSAAATIPSPKFSESERHFLLKTLGMESPCPNSSPNPSRPPPCRRALLNSL